MASTVLWGHSALKLVVDVSPGGPVGVRTLSGTGREHPAGGEVSLGGSGGRRARRDSSLPVRATQPLVEVLVAGVGRARASHRFSQTAIGRRLAHVGSSQTRDGLWHELRVDLRDEDTGLSARACFRSAEGVSACQVRTELTNEGRDPLLLLGTTSFAVGFSGYPLENLDLVRGDSEWLGESRWTRQRLRQAIADLNLRLHAQDGRGRLAVASKGSWSTGAHLPTGGLIDRESGRAWLWQIEHNGGWRWEVGERLDGAYLALLGPTDIDHQWQHRLEPGQTFTTVPVSIAVSGNDLEGAVAALTQHRRALVRPHRDRSALPVVFNDYMNTLMGDPTTAKLLPLIDSAAAAGAEVFCIDAGWYDNGTIWWDTVGEWQPSQTRFPCGIEEVLARIRHHGMVAGLWLEPEVIGVRSPMADKLPAQAFLQRGGVRVVEHDRYHLDLRHPSAVAHLDEVIDRLVEQLGIGYLKLDYNIDPGAGTDLAADSAGAGLLGHNRAHLAWLDRILERHPDVILENCASGGMRMDYALLSRMHLQSTSDQQDFVRYPPIAVAAPMSVLPEQSASWAYPQPDMSDEQIAFTMCTGMLGRLYLSGHLDGMDARQQQSVRAAVAVHKSIRAQLARAVPMWPLGLPGWTDPWLSLALRSGNTTCLGVWHRDGHAQTVLSLPHLRGVEVTVEVLYPTHLPEWSCHWEPGAGSLTVVADTTLSARIFRITPKEIIP